MKFDIIGDIHGHADKLVKLLEKLGYCDQNAIYRHPSPDRKAIFVGDFIDRGRQIGQTLEIVKSMCDRKAALAVLGNHEYNALCYHTQNGNKKGEWLRPHTKKNKEQHQATLDQFEDQPEEWKNYRDWFMSLPLFLDLGDTRIVHAAWVSSEIDKIRKWTDCGPTEHPHLTSELLRKSAQKGSEEYNAFEAVLKGVEIKLPDGYQFNDKEKNPRNEIRIRWWEPAEQKRYGEMIFPRDSLGCSDQIIEPEKVPRLSHYSDPVPVFFGHYWCKPGKHGIKCQADNICCLDYSVAQGGKLVAYRWEGESKLNGGKLIMV